MPYALDHDLMQAVMAMLSQSSLPTPADRDDWRTLRANGEAGLARLTSPGFQGWRAGGA